MPAGRGSWRWWGEGSDGSVRKKEGRMRREREMSMLHCLVGTLRHRGGWVLLGAAATARGGMDGWMVPALCVRVRVCVYIATSITHCEGDNDRETQEKQKDEHETSEGTPGR